jgi:hypothetical protein
MDCGDTGHILLSKHVAEDLEQLGHWKRHLHDLGDTEVKHGAHVSVVNLYTEELGNPEVPQKFRQARQKAATPAFGERRTGGRSWIIAAARNNPGCACLGRISVVRHSTSVASRAASISGIPEKSIAVLPFENRSEDKANAYFADGIQDEILTRLSKIADLKVISRTSTHITRALLRIYTRSQSSLVSQT